MNILWFKQSNKEIKKTDKELPELICIRRFAKIRVYKTDEYRSFKKSIPGSLKMCSSENILKKRKDEVFEYMDSSWAQSETNSYLYDQNII